MNMMRTLFFTCFVIGVAFGQGFLPQFLPTQQAIPSRRQLTPVQQTHILSDIQQHQHRFAAHQNQVFDNQNKNFGQKGPTVLVEPSIQAQLPTQTSIVPIGLSNQFYLNQQVPNNFRIGHVQHHTQTNFVPNFSTQQSLPVQFPQQSIPDRPITQQQQVYQRSVQNQQFDPQQPFKPSQPLNSPLPTLLLPTQISPDQQFVQNLPVSHPSTLQNQLFLQQGRLPQEIAPQTQLLQVQTSQQINPQYQQSKVLNGLAPPLFINQQPQFQQQPQQQQPSQAQYQPQPTTSQIQSNVFADPRLEEQRLKELAEKQKLIQKHEQFVQRQYQKQQQKVRQLHDEFVQKQRKIKEQSVATRPSTNFFPQPTSNTNNRGRVVSPFEANLFEKAVQGVEGVNPTAIPTNIVTPTPNRLKGSRSNLKGDISEEELERLLQSHQDKILNQIQQSESTDRLKITKGKGKATATKALGREDLLKQLKLALADQPQDLGNKTYSSMDVVLPDGQTVQVIRTTDPNLIQGAQPLNGDSSILSQVVTSPQQLEQPSQKDLIEEVADGSLLPPGSNFEVIKQSANGDLQKVGSLPNKKKVTFVYLEEQNDGSYKVQGVKANGEKEAKTKGEEVDNIIKRIKNGEILLPPPSNNPESATASTTPNPSRGSTAAPVTPSNNIQFSSINTSPRDFPTGTPSPTIQFGNSVSPYSTLATIANEQPIRLTASPSSHFPSTTASSYHSTTPRSIYSTRSVSSSAIPETNLLASQSASVIPSVFPTSATSPPSALSQIFKANGLHAMAKYLRQSGLDAILNETGPYTVFAPTDKAFKSLLVQLGGPDRAEEKFKTNPRLLSGLLLHHVIPGQFEIKSLQDEMTGVSLAGTQLRVNQYNMHDAEWNDVKITTINGATVALDKKDIVIPQGIAHAVDRVMFPLPVGDLLQTLQSDRERRFTYFLRALFTSGLSDILQSRDSSSSKTYTVFAPTDNSFSNLTQEEINFMVSDKEASHKLVMRHISAGTLFSSGMRFYQVRDSLQAGSPITLQKTSAGKIKVNESQIITTNVPATNGVIHAIDTLL